MNSHNVTFVYVVDFHPHLYKQIKKIFSFHPDLVLFIYMILRNNITVGVSQAYPIQP